MSSALSAVPPSRRRAAATVAAAAAVLLLVVGVLPWVVNSPVVVRVLAAVCLVVGVGVGLVAWGLARSVGVERRERALDAAIADITGSCDCGHDHTPPGRKSAVDAAQAPSCAAECGGGSCATCVLSR